MGLYVGNKRVAPVVTVREPVEDPHRCIEFQAPTAENGYTWYRKYADGWVEQGGRGYTNNNNTPRKMTSRNLLHDSKLIKTITTFENENRLSYNNNLNSYNKFFFDDVNSNFMFLNDNNEEVNNSFKSGNKRINELKNLWDYDDGGINSITGNEIYFFGIIDILTDYNCKKSAEHFFKMIRYCSQNFSCVPPIFYKNRFNNYIENIILNSHPSKETQLPSDNNKILNI